MNLVIRPPRAQYDPDRHLPGPRFKLGGVPCKRVDVEVTGALDLKLKCSHYQREDFPNKTEISPCVIYLHGNSGSRCDATDAVRLLLPMGIDVFALDFGGSGLSQGTHVSLGSREKVDVARVIRHLRESGSVGKIGLWGTSMGAVTALLSAHDDPSIASVVLDSPFASLRDLMQELVEKWTSGGYIGVPRAATRVAAGWMRTSIKSRADFDIDDLEIERIASSTFCPALFAHGELDDFIDKKHSERLHQKYAGDSRPLKIFDGDHNSPRPSDFFDDVEVFFQQTMWETVEETRARRRGFGVASNGPSGDADFGLGLTPPDGVRRIPRRTQDCDDDTSNVVRVRDVLGSPTGSPPKNEEAMLVLKSMGFEEPRATYALRQCGGDVDAAVVFLLDDEQEGVVGGSTDWVDPEMPTSRNPERNAHSVSASASSMAASDEFSDADLARALRLSLEPQTESKKE